MAKRLTDEQVKEISEMLSHCLPPGTDWVLVTIPSHEYEDHPGTGCPVQVAGTYDGEAMRDVLQGAAEACTGPMRALFVPVGRGQ